MTTARTPINYTRILAMCFCIIPLIAMADLSTQRSNFREARDARARGDRVLFSQLLPGLADYSLYGYLLYDDLMIRMDTASDTEVHTFLTRYGDLPVASNIRSTWLKRLANMGRWNDFLNDYQDTRDAALRCLRVQARLATQTDSFRKDPLKEFLDEIKSLWLVGKTQPTECDASFDAWHTMGGMTLQDRWQRISLAFSAGNVSLADQLALSLPENEQKWAELWSEVHRDPRVGLADPILANDSSFARAIIRHGLTRLARLDLSAALDRWEIIKHRYSFYAFSAAERQAIERAIALRAFSERNPKAVALLEHLSVADGEVRRARIRAALWSGDWAAVLRHVRALKPWERAADRWRYWEARALEETGQSGGAEEIYGELASHRGYHGFLAADHLNRSYAFNHHPLMVSDAEMTRAENRPALVRAHELFLTEYLTDARREWMAALTGAGASELAAAAQLAARWGWADRVIATFGRSQEEDDLVLRFPLEHRDQVLARAAAVGISPAAVFAVVRQESVFMSDARSAVGAMGLMQLMPATATQVATELKIAPKSSANLLDPDYNLRLGSAFLAKLIKLQGSLALAAAAYNAGPGRVHQWKIPARMAMDVWIECIPFDETRRYVRNVLTYAAIYDWRLDRPIGRLSARMSPTGYNEDPTRR